MNMRILPVVLGFLLSACGDDPPPTRPVVEVPPVLEPATPIAVPESLPEQPRKVVKKVALPENSSSDPLPSVDLRLPRELVEELRFDGPLEEEQGAPLLPPLFGDKAEKESRFRLDGSLFTNENLLDGGPSVKAIDGAEVQLEYKN